MLEWGNNKGISMEETELDDLEIRLDDFWVFGLLGSLLPPSYSLSKGTALL